MKTIKKGDDQFHTNMELDSSFLQGFRSEDIFQKIPIGIAIIDPVTSKFLFINSNFAQILGYTQEELLRKTFQSITHPDDLNKNLELHEKLRKGETDSYTIEKRNVRKDGSVIWVDLTVTRVKDKKNRREFHLGAIFDLSTRKFAEQKLKGSEELFRSVITNAPISIFATDENGFFTLHEGKAIERAGMKAGENVGASAYDLFAGLKVTEHNGLVTSGESILDRVSKGENLSGITELNGIVFDNYFAPIWDENGKVAGLLGVATDITDQKQAEDTLRKSENNLNEAQHLAKIGSWEWDIGTDTINWSKEYYRIYGFDPQKSPPGYEEHLKVYTPESIEVLDSAVKASMETGASYDLELELTSMTGRARWVRARGECKFDLGGKIIGLRGTAQDITEHKKQEEYLRYRAEIAANLSDGVSLIREEDGIIVHTNLRFREMFGYDKGELIGKHISVLNAPVLNRNSRETAKTIIKSVHESGKWKGVVYNVKKDGSFFWSQASVTQFEHSIFGTVFITIQMDITEQVQAEMALLENEIRQRAMIANISDVIAIVDRNGINRFKSPNVEKWFGWKAEDLIGKNTFDYIHSEDKDRIKDDFYSLLAEPGKAINTECRYLCKDNLYKWIELKAVNQIDNQAISGVLVNYHDISERKKAREKIIRHEKELKLLSSELINTQEKEKKILAIELHDEIGQALTAMKINLSAILKNIPAETNNQVCERINESNQLLDTIISRIHDISLDLRPAMLDLLGFTSTIKSYTQQFEKRTSIKVQVTENRKTNLNTEQEINLFRIVQEALNNVAKHADAKNIEIFLNSGRKWFELTIKDDGKGFDTNPNGEITGNSLGIGLIGMNERANVLQGKFSISSNRHKGTKIEIKVPLHGQKK